MIDLKKITSVALAAAIVAVPMSASALTIRLQSGAAVVDIVDGGVGDADGIVNNIVSATSVSVGSATVSVTSSFAQDNTGESVMNMNVTNAHAGANALYIAASHTGFGGGAGAPATSGVSYVANASSLSVGGALTGYFGVDNGNALFSGGTYISAAETVTSTGATIDQHVNLVLNDPFSMSAVTRLSAGAVGNYDATLTAAIPLPAAGLMLLGALGGLGFARRRKNKQA